MTYKTQATSNSFEKFGLRSVVKNFFFYQSCYIYTFICLFAELWLEWVEDELPLAASLSLTGALQDLRELFERSVEDYMCEWTVILLPLTLVLLSSPHP